MELSTYFQPVSLDSEVLAEGEFYTNIASVSQIHTAEAGFPSLEGAVLAIVGICDDSGSPSVADAYRQRPRF